MKYTVKKLANISGVSVRTLHWYDEIDLLKPAYCSNKGYRYYEEEQLLLLQQILFFREIGFKLSEIRKILSASDFDKLQALKIHKLTMLRNIKRMDQLINTIDKTIFYLEGKQIMKNEELYAGFDPARQKEYEQYLIKYRGTKAEDLIFENKRNTAKWDKDEWDIVKNEGDDIHKALSQMISQGLDPKSNEVQQIIERHFRMINRFYHPSKEVYIGLTDLYKDHPDFRKFFDVYHPQLLEFISKAMIFYANKNL